MQWFIFIFLSLIFFITPFQKALYFINDIYPVAIMTIIIFFIFIIRQFIKNEIRLLKKSMFFLLLPLGYILSLPFADSPLGGWDSVLRWVFYSSFFILLIWTAENPKIKRLLPFLFQLLGAVISLSMLFDYYGWIDYPHAIVNSRFGGIFQYPNTFGMIMVLFFFFSVTNLTEDKINFAKIFLNTSLSIIYTVCFIQSSSRGMMLFFPFIWLFGLVMLPFKKQIMFLIYSFISLLSSFIVYQSMMKEESIGALYPGLFMMIVMIALSIGAIYLIQSKAAVSSFSFRFKFKLKKGTQFILPLIIVFFFILGLLDLINHGLVYQQLPSQLQDRIGKITLSSPTAKERLTFFKDALTMSKSSPIIGFGGGGWEASYKKFQSAPYISNKIHNGYLEWIIETGWFGFLLFLTVFVSFFYFLIRSYFKEKHSSLRLAVILALLTIFLHSFIDFNFSYGTVWLMILWLVSIGLSVIPVEAEINQNRIKQSSKPITNDWKLKLILITYSCVLIMGLIWSYRFISAEKYFSQANATNYFDLKEQLLQKAITENPNNTQYMLTLSSVYLQKYKQSKDSRYLIQAEQLLAKMGTTESQNSTILFQNALLSEKIGNIEQALTYYHDALNADHFNSLLYQDSEILKVKMSIDYREHHNIARSNSLLNSAIADYKQEEYWNGKVDHTTAGSVFNSRHFTISSYTQYYMGLAYFIKKDYRQVVKLTQKEPANDKIKDNLLALSILANQKLGKNDQKITNFNESKVVQNLRILLQKL